jgi:hypothetical protein
LSGRSEGGLSGHTTSAILGLLKHVLCGGIASRLNALNTLNALSATSPAATLGRLRLGLRLRLLIGLLGTLQDLLERHIAVDLHSSLHVSEPRVLTRTVAASFATTSGLGVAGAGFAYVVEFGAGFVAFGEGGGGEGVGFAIAAGHLKLKVCNCYTIYKYKIITLNKMTFIQNCEALYKKIRENNSVQECLNTATAAATTTTTTTTTTDSVIDIYEPLWFVYYMFFAIHNPKMEGYIQKKSTDAEGRDRNPQDIIKNMIQRRNYTSTIVFQLYTHAYTNKGNVTHIYPKYKNNILIKSFRENHLKTTAVLLRRECAAASDDTGTGAIEPTAALSEFLEYIITTQPTNIQSTAAIVNKINTMNYKRKDIIILALASYMKTDEGDINKKNIFITATEEDLNLNYT